MTKAMYATREFNDVGAGRSFAQHAKVDADAAVLANYKTAGLVTDVAPDVDAPAEPVKPIKAAGKPA